MCRGMAQHEKRQGESEMKIYVPILNPEDREFCLAALRSAWLEAERRDFHSAYWSLRRFVSILTNFEI